MIGFLFKVFKLNYQNKVISNKDIAQSYDEVASTYYKWLNIMNVYTDEIIEKHKDEDIILDLCAGTGYISNTILNQDITPHITAVDISNKMLNQITNKNIIKVNSDAVKYLEDNDRKFDYIYIGYALPYIEDKDIYQTIYSSLSNNGKLIFITNMKGTLKHSYKLIFKIMKNNRVRIGKVFNVKLKSKRYYQRRLRKNGFVIENVNTVNKIVRIKDKSEFINWILTTGAFAGVKEIFLKVNLYEELSKYVDKYYLKEGEYVINHKFLQITSRKGE